MICLGSGGKILGLNENIVIRPIVVFHTNATTSYRVGHPAIMPWNTWSEAIQLVLIAKRISIGTRAPICALGINGATR